jgi:hypothetical protein
MDATAADVAAITDDDAATVPNAIAAAATVET